MGNLTSCTSGGFSAMETPSPPPASCTPPLPPPAVARVLLIEGGALTFTYPIKVIILLLDYPFHVICPLDSLRPGQESLSSLLPDEELELGQLYLLLPLKTFENRHSMPSIGPLIRRNLESNMPRSQVPLKGLEVNRQMSMPNMPTRRYINSRRSICEENLPRIDDDTPAQDCGETAKLLSAKQKSDVGFSDLGDQDDSLYVGDFNLDNLGRKEGDIAGYNDPRRESGQAMNFSSARNSRNYHNSDVCSAERFHNNFDFSRENQKKNKRLVSRATFRSNNNNNNDDDNSQLRNRLCDTPSLQMAYRSAMLWRSRSWIPRLESITENKRVQSAAHE